MALTLRADFVSAGLPSGFVASLANAIHGTGGVGLPVSTPTPSAISFNTSLNADQEAQVSLSYTTRAECAVYCGAATAGIFNSNHYRVQTSVVDGNFDGLNIIKRLNGIESTLGSCQLIRGKYLTSSTIRIRKIDAGSHTIIQGWKDGIMVVEAADVLDPIQGSGFAGVWIDANSAGMGVDNFYAGNLPVSWVSVGAATNPTQSAGNDTTGDGSFSTPWASIKKGADEAQMSAAGEVCMARGGNYSARLQMPFSDLAYRAGTSWDNPTTIQSYPGESAILTYTGGAATIAFLNATDKYIQFLNISGTGTGVTATSGNAFLFVANAATFIRLQGGELQQYPNHAISSAQLSSEGIANYGHELMGITIHDCANPVSSPQRHGIYTKNPGTIIEYCAVSVSGFNGIQHQPVPSESEAYGDDSIFRYNDLFDNGHNGLLISYADDCRAYGNVIRGNATNGVAISSNSGSGHPPERTLLFNNVVFKNGVYGIDIGTGSSHNPPDNTVNDTVAKNNISYKNIQKGINVDPTYAVDTVLDDNLNPTTGTEIDPLFQDETPGSEDFHLQFTSPARDTENGPFSDVTAHFTIDKDGIPQTATPDQGPFQFAAPASNPENVFPVGVILEGEVESLVVGFNVQNSAGLVRVRLRLSEAAKFTTIDQSGGGNVG